MMIFSHIATTFRDNNAVVFANKKSDNLVGSCLFILRIYIQGHTRHVEREFYKGDVASNQYPQSMLKRFNKIYEQKELSNAHDER
ncbi:hypothetical protein XV74_04755 [Vibrio cholerae]|nr:hypothetical protein XV74_04755 [Vibrio cholerae]KQA45091.1 hypothetical protein XV75_10865 [Vibrio cholerae]KQA57251.1 hypothetical protein XV79_08570 [Vibrio cholerae]KQA72239.1 hypothetical protein XV84_16560 [Vibrio cholerae]KQA80461.1 hypothetical protein XV85_01155 [Vibrio cholerae]